MFIMNWKTSVKNPFLMPQDTVCKEEDPVEIEARWNHRRLGQRSISSEE